MTSTMGSVTGSTTVRRRLGQRLRQLREAAGKKPADVAEAKIASTPKLWRIENGKIPVRIGDVYALCHLYGVSSEETTILTDQALGTQGDWWEDFTKRRSVEPWLGMYVGMEQDASVIRAFHGDLVFGLLQSPDYARAVIASIPGLSDQVVDERVAFRIQRQKNALERDDPAQVHVILGTGALLAVVGSEDVMRVQREHLRQLNERENVTIQVLPWTAGVHAGMKGAFTILDFANPEDPETVHVESHLGTRYLEGPEELRKFVSMFHELADVAIPIEEFR